mgnify:CR=1 FL=1
MEKAFFQKTEERKWEEENKMKSKILWKLFVYHMLLLVGTGTALAAEKSTDEVAKQLSNPASSLASGGRRTG